MKLFLKILYNVKFLEQSQKHEYLKIYFVCLIKQQNSQRNECYHLKIMFFFVNQKKSYIFTSVI
jgi:hypothetical protein